MSPLKQKMGLSPGLLRIALGSSGSLNVRLSQMKRALKEVLPAGKIK